MDHDYNPYLDRSWPPEAGRDLASERIERADSMENISWQTRAAPPTPYEDALAEALIGCFDMGIEEIAPLVRRLNEMGLKTPDGGKWTEETFERVMAELGA